MFEFPVGSSNDENTNTLNKQPSITIQYTLPNQTQQHTLSQRIDLTIDYFKLQLYKLHNIELHTYNIYSIDNKILPEPMSLCDFKFVKNELTSNKNNPTVTLQLRYTDEYAHLNNVVQNDSTNAVDTDDELDELEDDDLVDSSTDED